jgi:hypothetical protein
MLTPIRFAATAALLSAALPAAQAQTHRANSNSYTVEAGLLRQSARNDDASSQTMTAWGGTIYLQDVSLAAGQPFAERDFLQRASQITAELYSESLRNSPFYADTTADTVHLNGTAFLERLVLGLSFDQYSTTLAAPGMSSRNYSVSGSIFEGSLGLMEGRDTLVSYRYHSRVDSFSPSLFMTPIGDYQERWHQVFAHSVIGLRNDHAIVLDGGLKLIQRAQDADIAATQQLYGSLRAYLNPRFYAEGGISQEFGDPSSFKGRTLSFGLGLALTPRLVGQVFGTRFTADDPTLKSGHRDLGFTLNYRF